MTYYLYILCEQFTSSFEAKIDCIENNLAKKVNLLLNDVTKIRKSCKEKIKTVEWKDIEYR